MAEHPYMIRSDNAELSDLADASDGWRIGKEIRGVNIFWTEWNRADRLQLCRELLGFP